MLGLRSKRFRTIWSYWTLVLGVSLFFFHAFPSVNSVGEYLNAFLVFDMPSSWCPTFLTLYGASSLLFRIKVFNFLAKFSGVVLLPIGVYTLVTYTLGSQADSLGVYIYAQTIHLSEFITGVYTVYFWKK